VRVPALVSGGFLPAVRRGKTTSSMMHIADLYATFVHLAFKQPSPAKLAKLLYDASADSANLPLVDSVNMWPAMASASGDGRSLLHLSPTSLISGAYKLLVGNQSQTLWTGPVYPNATGEQPIYVPNENLLISDDRQYVHNCGDGCLFNIVNDPTEHVDIAAVKPLLVKKLTALLTVLNQHIYKPVRGTEDPQACLAAAETWGGVLGPFLPDLPS